MNLKPEQSNCNFVKQGSKIFTKPRFDKAAGKQELTLSFVLLLHTWF